jgi:hypothetical protein
MIAGFGARRLWRERGALALRRDGPGFVIESARPPNFDRPRAPRPPRAANADNVTDTHATTPAPPGDATPPPQDLQADD